MNALRALAGLLRGEFMARRRTQTQSSKIRGPRRKKAGLPKEILSERYAGDQLGIFRPVGSAAYEIVKTGNGKVVRITEPSGDRMAHLATSIEPPIGGPLTLVSVAVRVRGRKSATNSASALEIAVEADGHSSDWQSITLSSKLAEDERIFTFNGDGRFESSSIKLRPSADGQSAVIEQIEIKAMGRAL